MSIRIILYLRVVRLGLAPSDVSGANPGALHASIELFLSICYNTSMKEVKKRILWVDIAKALAILSVPISHTLELDQTLRAMIFSFHMPLFFILSGFTTHLAEDKLTLLKRLKKNFKYLIIPTLVILAIFSFAYSYYNGEILNFFQNFGYWLKSFFIDVYPPDGLYNASAVWFLVALFWAKLLMDIVNITVKTDKNGLIFFVFGVIGICMGVFEHRIPFFVDLGLVATMFMEIGLLWRRHEKIIKKYTTPLLILACVYWFSSVMRGCYLEFWLRFYAGYEASILTAIAGTFIVANLAMLLEDALKKAGRVLKFSINSLVTLGKNTMLFYLIHCLDTIPFFFKLWYVRDGTMDKKLIAISCVLRLALNLAVFLIIYHGLKFLCSKKSEKA